ncbi:MAG: hypothetical protein ACI84C_001037 [Flavobacteriales bacterium]|jgi:hypothetical protein
MYKILTAITILLSSLSIAAQPVMGEANLSIESDIYDFGQVDQFELTECIFVVTNTGDQPLIISKCQKSCGCTTPQCNPDPIMPGETSDISIKYDSGRVGPFNKSITVHSNDLDEPKKVLRIKGEILAQKKD